ncbi:MAG: ribosome biogenesis GTP-binding protein YihA/YsxC [Myxococcota bacterium]
MKVTRAEHWTACGRPGEFPAPVAPEFAFLGRSNVGKSSLINRLVARKALARTSSTPGKTRLIHFYGVTVAGIDCTLVDLPGYGYAKVSQKEREKWRVLVESYLGARAALAVGVLLQDVRRDVSDDERELLEWLAGCGVESLVAITKADKLKTMRRGQRVRVLREAFGLAPERLIPTSAQTGLGIGELWKALLGHLESESDPRGAKGS